MAYLIDGHNLIPHLPGLSLSALDDEMGLIPWLQDFCRKKRKQVEVYFDNAPAGLPGERNFGMVKAHFVRQGNTADNAIRDRLHRLGKSARNWVVVSSDRQVQAEARSTGARAISSEQFARDLLNLERTTGGSPDHTRPLSPEEIQEWLTLFGDQDDS